MNPDSSALPSPNLALEILEATPCKMVVADATQPHFPLIYSNSAFKGEMAGERDELVQKNSHFLQRFGIEISEIQKAYFQLQEAQKYQVVGQHLRQDGSWVQSEFTLTAIRNETGNLTHLVAVQTEITPVIQVQEKQQEIEERLTLALETAQMGIWEYDLQTQRSTCSQEVPTILGFDPSLGHDLESSLLQWIHEQDRPWVEQELQNVLAQGHQFRLEYRLIRPDGTMIWVVDRGIVHRDETGKPIHITGTVMDITASKQAEESLRQQFLREHLLRSIAERIRESLNIEEVLNTAVSEIRQFLQTDRVLLYRFGSDWSGRVVVESVLDGWQALIDQEFDDPCFREKMLQPYQQGRVRAVDNIHQSNLKACHVKLLASCQVNANLVVPVLQGEHLWGLLIAHHCRSPRNWQTSEVELLQQLSVQLGIAIQQSELYHQAQQELQERKQTEIALRQSESQFREQAAQLQQALEDLRRTQSQLVQIEKMSSLGQLVAGVAHEINNPISFIYGNLTPALEYAQDLLELLELYQQNYPQPVEVVQEAIDEMDLEFVMADFPKLLSSMRVGADRIRDLVISLRNFSRLDEAQKKPVNIHDGIDSTLLILRHRLKAHQNETEIQIIKNYSDLPQVECYAGQLNQVFMNLISNAIDALQEKRINEPPAWIKVSTEMADAETIVIRIADNGPGIPDQIKARIFDPFFTTKPVGEGTGLGLAISYQVVVERHGGQLRCLSTPEGGTEFVVEIPLQPQLCSLSNQAWMTLGPNTSPNPSVQPIMAS